MGAGLRLGLGLLALVCSATGSTQNAISTQNSAVPGLGAGEFWIRRVSLDPEGTQAVWGPRLTGDDWLQVYDVLDAMQRNPEAARWFCAHRGAPLKEILANPRSTLRAAALRILRMGQGMGGAVDLGPAPGRPVSAEDWAWYSAAVSRVALGLDRESSLYAAVLTGLDGLDPGSLRGGVEGLWGRFILAGEDRVGEGVAGASHKRATARN